MTHNNDFDWMINNGGTTSAATGPQSALRGFELYLHGSIKSKLSR